MFKVELIFFFNVAVIFCKELDSEGFLLKENTSINKKKTQIINTNPQRFTQSNAKFAD